MVYGIDRARFQRQKMSTLNRNANPFTARMAEFVAGLAYEGIPEEVR